jgi:hypothetical protein
MLTLTAQAQPDGGGIVAVKSKADGGGGAADGDAKGSGAEAGVQTASAGGGDDADAGDDEEEDLTVYSVTTVINLTVHKEVLGIKQFVGWLENQVDKAVGCCLVPVSLLRLLRSLFNHFDLFFPVSRRPSYFSLSTPSVALSLPHSYYYFRSLHPPLLLFFADLLGRRCPFRLILFQH